MSGIGQCGRCGGAIGPEGRCSVCGNPFAPPNQQSKGPTPNSTVNSMDPYAQAQRKDVRPARPAYLFNKLTGERYPLTQSVSKIGRDQTNNISITNDHYISRHHAWVLQMQGGYWVEDLGSTNGTLLNGEPLGERKQIASGDRLTFGKTELVFAIE